MQRKAFKSFLEKRFPGKVQSAERDAGVEVRNHGEAGPARAQEVQADAPGTGAEA